MATKSNPRRDAASEAIVSEFSRHSPDSPLMKAFGAWLEMMHDDAVEVVAAGSDLPHHEHRASGMVRQTLYQKEIFDGVLDEAEKRRKAEDLAKH